MQLHKRLVECAVLLGVISQCGIARAQITANAGDGVLNAPYRGTIDTLRECSAGVAYGEVRSHVEPLAFCTTQNPEPCQITDSTIDVWVEGAWDRSVLRLYEGLDASGPEIDLTGTSESSPAPPVYTEGTVKRFSFKAIGTKTLAPQTFTIRMRYVLNGSQITPTRIITVAPITGSFCDLTSESEAFILGTRILDVSAGNARLIVPIGRKARAIGAAFMDVTKNIAITGVDTNDVLLPGAAESTHIQNSDQFRLGAPSSKKLSWGTPWPGHLVGYQISGSDPLGPDGTLFDSLAGTPNGLIFRRIDYIRPMKLASSNAAAVHYAYDDSTNNRVVEIADQASPPNVITLTRSMGDVTSIATSDGRSWTITSDSNGWVKAIEPSGGIGKRSYVRNSAGRVTQVNDASGAVMYEFVYVNDATNMPTILTEERRVVDGVLRTVVKHEVVSEELQRRWEFTGPGNEFRQVDFRYDLANGLNHRLASITRYGKVNTTGVPFTGGAGMPYTTTFTHDVENLDGSMALTHVDLPDGTAIDHEYDSHVGGQSVDFGFRTKSTRTGPNDGSLVTFDVDYEFFFQFDGTKLYHRPRIVKQRDGRGVSSEITFDYDDGGECIGFSCSPVGYELNRLRSITGPAIVTGPSAPRTPQIRFVYDDGLFGPFLLVRKEVDYASGLSRAVEYDYDPLRRVKSTTVDPGGLNLVTHNLFCDIASTQDRITVDPDDYWTRTRFDGSGRVETVERFLSANAGNINDPCADPAEPVYRRTNHYDSNGWLDQRTVENKDQDGQALKPTTLMTTYGYDKIGRLELQTVDPGGIGQESNFDYNWLGDTEREFDTSGRGMSRTFDGRRLIDTETPLALDEAPDTNLTATFAYDAMGNLRFTNRPTGAVEERIYDDFDRIEQIKRIPGPDGGDTITTTFEYDAASNVTRTTVDEGGTFLSDTTALIDEGGFDYETRRRLTADVDGSDDPLTQRKFDWAGNVIEEKSLGDATVSDRVITTMYDGANRVHLVADNLGGETVYTRDGRGNATERAVKIDASNSAVTTTVYDALSRAIQITSPKDGSGGRPDRIRRYDSRSNLLRETIRDAIDVPKLTTVFGYDNAGRQNRQAVLANAASAIPASSASVTADRVTDSVFDTDGRLEIRRTYNNNSATPLETVTTYDGLGRIDLVTDPSGSYIDEEYASNGRLSQRVVFVGVGARTFTFGFDGHDRIKSQTAHGAPDLVSAFALDGLDRQTRITDPKGIATRTDFDLVGRRERLVEDDGGALERQSDFSYNRQSQLIAQAAENKSSIGTPLVDQLTTYRYDSLGRQIRIVYPDSADHADPLNCADCVRQSFDLAGRMTQRTDQRSFATTIMHDDRGLLLTRTTGTDRDTFDYDAVGRVTLAERGTTVDPDAVSHSDMFYTDLGDLDYETQTIAGGTPRTVDYAYDQAGNRTQVSYPGGDMLAYTPTSLNQVDTVTLNTEPLLDYDYDGRMLDKRRTITSEPGAGTSYEYDVGYDSHRRVNATVNRFDAGGGPQMVASYSFNHDENGNPLTQTVTDGIASFVNDDRAFTVDRLNRLTDTEYFENGQFESTTFDLVGNRESHTDRAGTVTAFGTVNAANEYSSIGGTAVSYDAVGNLSVDQDGRQYLYDEQNRLSRITDNTGLVVLANYSYDALGRRIIFEDPVAGITTRYYYDGQSVIEERDGADVRVRYHVNGSQYIDERIATFSETTTSGTATPVYYLANSNFSIAGMGNADGSVIERLDYSSTGDFAGGGPSATAFYHDAPTPDPPNPDIPPDTDIDLRDFANLQNCFDPTGMQATQACLNVHDFDIGDASDGDIDLDDYGRFGGCLHGVFVTPHPDCSIPILAGSAPHSGTFGMHGRAFDVLSDGSVLQDFRARTYLPHLGRWLQRDPLAYSDGPSLYEAFRTNPLRFTDPFGRQSGTEEGSVFDAFENFYYLFATPEGMYERATETNPIKKKVYSHLELQVDAAATLARDVEPVVARATGVVGAAGGLVETATGVVLLVPSLGASTVFILHGADVTQAAGRQAYSGAFTPTLLYSSLAERGYPTTALIVDVGLSVGSGFAGIAAVDDLVTVPARLASATSSRSSRVLDYAARTQQRLAVFLFDAQPGDAVFGSGLSPGPIAGKQLTFPFAETPTPRIVFRVIRPDENPVLGFFAKNPAARGGPEYFVQRGSSVPGKFISTTRDINVAIHQYRITGNQVVAIDLSRLPATSVVDLSSELARSGVLTNPRAVNFARSSAEVLVIDRVPPEAILPYVPVRFAP